MKILYLFLVTTPKIVQSCEDICEVCSLNSVIFTKNSCSGAINSTYQAETILCSYCLDSYNQEKVSCLSDDLELSSCETSDNCGDPYYNSAEGSLNLKKPGKSIICKWTLDLRPTKKSTQEIKVEFGTGQTGTLIVFSYLMSNNLNHDEGKSRIIATNSVTKESNSKNLKLNDCNYIVILYSTLNLEIPYSTLTLEWNQVSTSSLNLSSILTIVGLCISSLFCIFCSCLLCRRLYKSRRQQLRILDRSSLNLHMQSRIYQVVQETTVISEHDIERLFPKTLFIQDLLEVGECTCCICFEEINSSSVVRKLPCKHLFHAKCIEDWFVGRVTRPKCPLCKFSPFDNDEFPGLPEISAEPNRRDVSLLGLN